MLSKRKRPYDPAALAPRERLRANVADIASTGQLALQRGQEVCVDVNRVDPGSFADVARRSRGNAARNMRHKLRKGSAWMPCYWAQIRCFDVKAQTEVLQWLAFQLPHEYLAVLRRLGIVSKLLDVEGLDPLTLQHLREAEAACHDKLLALGIWGDGAPCNWDRSESVDVITMNLPGLTGEHANLRLPITSLSNKNISEHTWHDIFTVVKWSMEILATGVWPTCRHDGSPWRKTDHCRKTSRPLIKSALCEVRCDWAYLNSVFHFPAHNTKDGNCWTCDHTPEDVMPWGLIQESNHTCLHALLEAGEGLL